jgi:hypothetical protein
MLNVEPVREFWNLTVRDLGTVRIYKGGVVDLKMCEFENLT